MNLKVDLILFTSRKRQSDKRHPVVIRLMEGRERKYKRIGQYYYQDEWDFARNQPKKASNEVLRALIMEKSKYLDKISKMQADGENVSLDTILDDVQKNKQPAKVFNYFIKTIAKLKNESIGNYYVYRGVYKSFKTFLYGK